VVDAIGSYKKFDMSKIDQIREKKATERGRFNDRVILDEA